MGGYPLAALQVNPPPDIADQRYKRQQQKQHLQTGALDLQMKQQEAKDQQTVMQTLAKHNGDIDAALPELAGTVSARTFMGIQKAQSDLKSSIASLDDKKLQVQKDQHDRLVGLISQAQSLPPDQYAQQYPAIIQEAVKIKPDLAGHIDPNQPIPQEALSQFGLGIMTQAQFEARETAKRAEAKAKQDVVEATETARHNKATEVRKPVPGTDVPYSPEVMAQKKALKTSVNVMGSNDAKDIAEAIENGDQPPTVTGLYRNAGPVRAELARRGFNLARAESDWKATQKHLSTLNGAQQERLRQAITFTSDSTDVIEKLYDEWKQTGMQSGVKLFNRATLASSKNLPGKAGATATALEAQINDLTSELGTVYKGGNSSTDESLKLAASNLKADWNEETFKKALGLIRTNLKMRKNSITNSQVAGASADSPYSPQQAQPSQAPAKPAGATHTGIGSVDKKKHWLDDNGKDLGVAE